MQERDQYGYTDEEYRVHFDAFIKLIRKHTGIPALFCKKALQECNGNPYRAKELAEKLYSDWRRYCI